MLLHEMREDSQKCEKQGWSYDESGLICSDFPRFLPHPDREG
jgi:hypothetical protein